MRIFHIADIHIDLIATRLGKFKIVDGQNAIYLERLNRFKNLTALAVTQEVDMIVIAGDLFNRPKPFPQELWDVASILDNIPPHIRVIVIPGNHDEFTQRGCALQPLQNRRSNVDIVLTPRWINIKGVDFVIAPWGTDLDTLKKFRNLSFREKGVEPILDGPVMIGHLGTTLEGQHWTEIAGEIGTVALDDLKGLNFRGILLGHYHGQVDLGQNIWYPGSPECYNFGEAGQTKGFLRWDIADNDLRVQPHHLNDKPYFRTFTVEEFLDFQDPGFPGYVRIQGEANEQQKALVLSRLENFQCEDYKLDLQSTTKMTKVFTLKGKSNIEILTNWLESKNIPVKQALLELDQDIEGEVL